MTAVYLCGPKPPFYKIFRQSECDDNKQIKKGKQHKSISGIWRKSGKGYRKYIYIPFFSSGHKKTDVVQVSRRIITL